MISMLFAISCTDDNLLTEPELIEEKDYTDPTLPDEFKEGFSVTFNLHLDPIGVVNGVGTRVTNNDIMDIDNYVDLEKVRILFFICGKKTTEFDTSGMPNEIDGEGNVISGGSKSYYIGDQDYFLFESKSRWVSQLTTAESSEANWQVTAPIFTYGNNEIYDWDEIRNALMEYPFKVVVLVNRPSHINFGNFDNKFGEGNEVDFKTDRGPVWGPADSWTKLKENAPTINELHHCQWDAVYASKNNGDTDNKAWGTQASGAGVYTMIMKNPSSYNKTGTLPKPSEVKNEETGKFTDETAYTDMMGALSSWTEKIKENGVNKIDPVTNKEANFYFLPDKINQGIPMYGVQIFNPITVWTKGTPFNLSYGSSGQHTSYVRKNIHLLRSLVKLELKIPKKVLDKDGNERTIKVINPHLDYSNVMARCEPLDVATPPEILWKHESECEWENLLAYGPIINEVSHAGPDLEYFQERMAWFYGAWRTWWNFNENHDSGYGLKKGNRSEKFDKNGNVAGKPYPRIYNPVIQRNQNVIIDNCRVDIDDPEIDPYYYYVIYTGERNINDPSKFGQSTAYDISKSMAAFFHFQIEGQENKEVYYKVALTDYQTNEYVKKTAYYQQTGILMSKYIDAMAQDKNNPGNWNWPLLRNHCYTFTVNSFGDFQDPGGLDVTVVSTEKRTAPGFVFK